MIPFLYANRLSVTMPKVTEFFERLRENEAAKCPLGVAGYCWGGKYAINLAHGAQASNGCLLVDCAFAAHPSGLTIPEEIEKIETPFSMAIGDLDIVMGLKEVQKVERILQSSSLECEVRIYRGAHHGFAIRGDPGDRKEMEQGVEAEDQAVQWFLKHFASSMQWKGQVTN